MDEYNLSFQYHGAIKCVRSGICNLSLSKRIQSKWIQLNRSEMQFISSYLLINVFCLSEEQKLVDGLDCNSNYTGDIICNWEIIPTIIEVAIKVLNIFQLWIRYNHAILIPIMLFFSGAGLVMAAFVYDRPGVINNSKVSFCSFQSSFLLPKS